MKTKTFGTLAAAAVASLISGAVFADAAKKTASSPTTKSDAKKGEMVKCISNTCAGKFEYKGVKNSCDAKTDAMEVPKDICDPKKGLKVVVD